MNRDELYRKSLFNPQCLDFYLHNEYDDYIRKEYMRIVGSDFYQEITDIVLSSVRIRLPEISTACDVGVLVFDCLRKEILQRARKDEKLKFTINSTILKETNLSFVDENSALLIEVVLPLLSKKQLKYFLDRYYYFRDVKFNKNHERAICKLFKGKGVASARFKYFKIVSKETTIIPYVLYLEHLDFRCIEFLSDGTLISLSDKLLNMPLLYKLLERQYQINKYTIIVLAIILLIIGTVFCICLIVRP